MINLIINAALFLSMLFIIHYYIFKNPIFKNSPLKQRLIFGLCYGCVSIVLMFFHYKTRIGLVDLRHLPTLLVAFYGGWASVLAAWIVECIGRFFVPNQLTTYTGSVLILTLDAVIAIVIPQLIRSYRYKWMITLFVDVTLLTLILPGLFHMGNLGFWIVYAPVSILGGIVAFHLTESLRKSQLTLLELKNYQTNLENTVQHLDDIKVQLESFITHSADAIVILDTKNRVIKVNPTFEKVFGWTANDVIGSDDLPWIPSIKEKETFKLQELSIKNQSFMGYETKCKRKDGTLFHASVSISTVFSRKGDPIGFSGVYRDMTEKEQTQELLRNSEKLSVVGELAAGIAHEIRNPLTTLKGFIQLFSKDNSSFYLKIMESEIERIEVITNELLYLAKPQAKEIQSISMEELIQQVTILLTPLAALKNIQLSVQIDTKQLTITCVVNQLKQVLINLLKNSIEAMQNGGEIKINGRLAGEQAVHISISDQGVGIPEDRISKLGEPFYSLKEKGTGLGLTICKKIIQDHKGEISFTSKLGVGTVVNIRLPLVFEC